MMDRAKCRHCGKILEKQDMMYQVRIVESDGMELYTPCCSTECAYNIKHHYMKIHKARYNSVENQSFQYMTVENYGT